ncbi:hypothetical protein OCU04_001747 [Sclerotinia nivalis]|uniref:Uncharacterized protein n=1 Tax=Sclerotinia nivalis TaxID=352851 RepID=A0A9X0AYR8_9HELO|nr:hypothetical protein OCU04_001747 [Sclerotinia nivalis]
MCHLALVESRRLQSIITDRRCSSRICQGNRELSKILAYDAVSPIWMDPPIPKSILENLTLTHEIHHPRLGDASYEGRDAALIAGDEKVKW